ncbi:fish-egg lectin-like [Pseudorasbora parva]|uniref:fish-egg lectin-like n=1 Tax=Pseudorasbora parva TaxID=51549 RepID=UPI00351F7B3E
MKVYQIALLLFSCQFTHTLALYCVDVCGTLKQIDAGSGSVVGVNKQNEAFVLINNVFTRVHTSLKHFSVGPAGLLGVDTADNIYRLQGDGFVQISGLLKQVDAGGSQMPAGVNVHDNIYCSNMDVFNQWPINSSPWVQLAGKLKYYSCGPYSCWGVSSNDQIFIMKDVSSNVCTGSGTFEKIDGLLSMIEVATDGSVYGVNAQGTLYQRTGISRANPAGSIWTPIVVCPNGHKHVSFDLGTLWVVCADESIRRCTL